MRDWIDKEIGMKAKVGSLLTMRRVGTTNEVITLRVKRSEDGRYYTCDPKTGEIATSYKDLNKLYVGAQTYGFGVRIYEIIDIKNEDTMKLHEIDWTDGKEYEMSILGVNRKVRVCDGNILVTDIGKYATDLYTASALVGAEFTPISEDVTVDFTTAYNDCSANGTMYVDEYETCTINRDPKGNVELKVKNYTKEYSIVTIDRMRFTKVVD